MKTKLYDYLKQITTIEQKQLETGKFVYDFPNDTIEHVNGELQLNTKHFFTNQEIFVSKHNRFAAYPTHSHQFLELNYMYSGHCHQTINGEEHEFFSGDLILIDAGTSHSIAPLGENDLLINIVFRNQDIQADLLDKLHTSNSLLFDFLLNASTNIEKNSHPFLLFQRTDTTATSNVIDQIMDEYFFPRPYSQDIISSYLPILFTYLVRDYQQVLVDDSRARISDPIVTAILDEINNHWSETSLEILADKLSYNRYYLSNLVKNKTGKTFTQLLNQQKLLQAQILITSTKLPISEIIRRMGFSNKNYFYAKYQQKFGQLPSQTRKAQKA